MAQINWRPKIQNQQGLASIVVVGVLIVLLTVISLGFAKIMDRTVRNSLNDHTATAANYAAQSGINDLATFIRDKPNVKSDNCRDLIGTSTSPGPFYNASNLSGDRNSEYTCLLLNQRPEDLVYDKLPAMESKVIKITADATVQSSIDRFLISWQSAAQEQNNQPPNGRLTNPSGLPDVAAWNSASSGLCRDPGGNNDECIPMLRVTLYPVPSDERLEPIQANSRTFFLYPRPQGAAGSTNAISYASFTDGDLINVSCLNSTPGSAPGFDNLATLNCNFVVNGLADWGDASYYYLRVMPIYNSVDLTIRARDIDNRDVKFVGVQAVLDVTAKVGPASKRLQARVDIGGNPLSSGGTQKPSPNVGAADDAIPDFSTRSANAICKRYLYNDSPYAYTVLEGVNTDSCVAPGINIQAPVINYFRINGINDTDPTPANPYFGVYYLPANGTAPLTWATEHVISCEGLRGTGAWAGNKNGQMNWSGSSATGSQNIPGISSVTYFDLRCQGPNASTSTRTTVAWPTPTVSFAGTDTSYRAGQNFNIRFSSTNSSRCVMSSTGNFSWNQTYNGISNTGGTSPSDSRSFPSSIYDQSAKSFTVTCNDPSGRSVSLPWTVCLSGCNTTILPPDASDHCPVSWSISNNGDGTGTLVWSGDCPRGNGGAGYYRFTDCNASLAAQTNNCGDVGNGRNTIVGAGEYCGNYWGGFDPWGWLNQTGYQCFTITMPQVVIDNFQALVWHQAPQCYYPNPASQYHWAHLYWYCRNGRTPGTESNPATSPGCANEVHAWTACPGDIRWRALLSDGSGGASPIIQCRIKSGYGYFSGTHNGGVTALGSTGWVGMGTPYAFYVECKGPTPGPGPGGINTARACWNGGPCEYQTNPTDIPW